MLLLDSENESRLFLGRVACGGLFGRAAKPFLLNPSDHIGRTIFDRYISRLRRAKEYHRFAIHKRHIRQVERRCLRGATLITKQALDFRNVLLSQLPAQTDSEGAPTFPSWSDL